MQVFVTKPTRMILDLPLFELGVEIGIGEPVLPPLDILHSLILGLFSAPRRSLDMRDHESIA